MYRWTYARLTSDGWSHKVGLDQKVHNYIPKVTSVILHFTIFHMSLNPKMCPKWKFMQALAQVETKVSPYNRSIIAF